MPAFEDIVKANDVRGVVPDQLSANITRAFGAAFADHVGADVVVGHDM
ncbi:MAG TPA: phosphomannomutase/phosphoglucomutase, partial [Beutenbergiaceae bacterium]|nr:phosphomannomutase/phosphoglucomutase [Beutenbergiaceae bacterium]